MAFDTYIHGVDISRYQIGPNDFGALRRAGYDFAVQRWGVGTYRDPTRVTNIRAIAAAGLIPGAYFVPGEHTGSGGDQAARFVTEVRDALPTLPLLWVLDAEHSTAYGDPTARQCADFCAEIRHRTGRVTLGYIPRWWMDGQHWTRAQVEAVAANALWWQSRYRTSPDFARPPDAGGYQGWPLKLWQWTSTGPAPGIPGNCDKDVFYGTRAELAALTGVSAPPPPVLEDDMKLYLVSGNAVPDTWFLTDWLTRRHVEHPDLNTATWVTTAAGNGATIERDTGDRPYVIDQEVLDAIPDATVAPEPEPAPPPA